MELLLLFVTLYVGLRITDGIWNGLHNHRLRHGIGLDPIQQYQYYIKDYSQKHIKELRRMNYQAYLRTKHWHMLREAVLFRDNHRCFDCGTSEKLKHLEAHHMTYKNRGHEQVGDLISLCHECHQCRHEIMYNH